MPENSNKHKVTLETLLQLKKSERPKAEFWESFEKDFDRRRLHALVNPPSLREILIGPAFKVFALGLPAIALVLMALVWSPTPKHIPGQFVANDISEPADKPVLTDIAAAQPTRPQPMDLDLDSIQASSQFVLDAIQDSSDSVMPFRKVLYTPAIRLSVPSGAFYVRDNMIPSNYQVTTADVKLGRNF